MITHVYTDVFAKVLVDRAAAQERAVIEIVRWLAADPKTRGAEPDWDGLLAHRLADQLYRASEAYLMPPPGVPIPSESEVAQSLLAVLDPPDEPLPF